MSKPVVSVLALLIALTGIGSAAPDVEALGRDTVAELATGAFDKVVARFDEKMAASLRNAEALPVAESSVHRGRGVVDA